MSLLYRCDGCGETLPARGKGGALPAGWVHVVVDDKGVQLCLRCELRRRAERET